MRTNESISLRSEAGYYYATRNTISGRSHSFLVLQPHIFRASEPSRSTPSEASEASGAEGQASTLPGTARDLLSKSGRCAPHAHSLAPPVRAGVPRAQVPGSAGVAHIIPALVRDSGGIGRRKYTGAIEGELN